MDLIFNSTFRILEQLNPSTPYTPGVYRVVMNEPRFNMLTAVLILPEGTKDTASRGGRRKQPDSTLKNQRKKPPPPHVGKLVWMDSSDIKGLIEKTLLAPIAVERRASITLGARAAEEFDLRCKTMQGFLDIKNLQSSLVVHKGLGDLVAQAMDRTQVSRSYVRDLQNSRTQVNYLHAGVKNEGEHRLEGWKIRVSNHELGAHR